MRVTKRVEQYVYNKVLAAYQDQIDDVKQKNDEIEKPIQEAKEKAVEAALNVLRSSGLFDDSELNNVYISYPYTKIRNKFLKDRPIYDAINDDVQRILIEMDLGATKDKLEEILKDFKPQKVEIGEEK